VDKRIFFLFIVCNLLILTLVVEIIAWWGSVCGRRLIFVVKRSKD